MSNYKLQIKDGAGDAQELYVDSGSNGLVPYHAISGTVSTAMDTADLSAITASIEAVSGAVGLFSQQLFDALTGGPVSMSVDIVAGDVNAITGAIDMTTTEVAKLTALSSSEGLKVYTLETASVNLVNTGSLTASISNFPATQSVSFDTGSVLTASIGNFPATQSVSFSADSILTASVNVSNWPVTQSVLLTNTGSLTASIQTNYSNLVSSGSASYNEFSIVSQIYNADAKTLTISNQLNGPLYIKLDSVDASATDSDYTYVLNATETYEAMQQNVRLHHGLSGSATSGRVRWTYTY
jgi:hypothetical protein